MTKSKVQPQPAPQAHPLNAVMGKNVNVEWWCGNDLRKLDMVQLQGGGDGTLVFIAANGTAHLIKWEDICYLYESYIQVPMTVLPGGKE